VVEDCIQKSKEPYQRAPRILITQEVSPTIAGKRDTVATIVCFVSFYSLFLVLKLGNKCESVLERRERSRRINGRRKVGPV
jgi:hypothetical protein